jgi:(1->4)-alpha-D-glucan 1-alpha-D-glucosylmutase
VNDNSDSLFSEVVRRVTERRVRPRATYRVQLTAQFTLRDATALISYLSDLGISHLYTSPYLKARPGSSHGYDVCDHGEINAELGGPDALNEMVAGLRTAGLGHIIDFVPNHMSASTFNRWWTDVLENGPSSPYSGYFDIDWQPLKDELEGKVLLPILGQQYGEALESGELTLLHFDGAFFVRYYQHTLPLEPKSTLVLLAHRLDELRQALGKSSEECIEYESILTAVDHLPPQIDTSPEAVDLRQREKEVIKRRLRELESRSTAVADLIGQNLVEFAGRAGDPASFDRLDILLDVQPYRLCHWRAASDEINYRRFFDINELAALSMESPQVFRHSHALIGRLLGEGALDGLRIDHIDGLLNPEQYLWRLQWLYLAEITCAVSKSNQPDPGAAQDPAIRALDCLRRASRALGLPQPDATDVAAVLGDDAAGKFRETALAALGDVLEVGVPTPNDSKSSAPLSDPPLYVVVEKILGPDEPLPESWATAGTTGYDFLKALGGLFIDPAGWPEMQRLYLRFLEETLDFDEVGYDGKQLILRFAMASELQMLSHRLNRISEHHRRSRDFTLNMLRHALREILATFPVYRTYVSTSGVSDRDRKFVQLAIARAKRRNPAVDSAVFDFIRGVLLLEKTESLSPQAIREREDFTGRFQQVTSPVMAKGVEDTAFYVYCPLLSANEVGGDPRAPTCSVADFHRENQQRLSKKPVALLATSTHDTKRSEDVRARIAVLSEIPGRWRQAVNRWARLNRRHRQEVDAVPAPSRNDEYVFYQSLVGAWPLSPPNSDELHALTERMQQYMEKASHEAKQRTSWINPDAAYDQALRSFIGAAMAPGRRNRFLSVFQQFHEEVVGYGLHTALCQTILKLTSPGIPDIYQGQELWDFSLVDPDNRRPVDYDVRRWLLGEIQAAASEPAGLVDLARQLGTNPRDSRSKLFVTWRLLNLRREQPELFLTGEYVPLEVLGARQQHIVAFLRRAPDGSQMLVVVPRLIAQLLGATSWETGQPRAPLGQHVWLDTEVVLPAPLAGEFTSALTGEPVGTSQEVLSVAQLLQTFPAAVAVSKRHEL